MRCLIDIVCMNERHMQIIIKDSEHIEKKKNDRKRANWSPKLPLRKQRLYRNSYLVLQLISLKEILVAVVSVARRMGANALPLHSAETFLSLACPFVNLTLSSLARLTMESLFERIVIISNLKIKENLEIFGILA